MPCPYKFRNQCNIWKNYAITSIMAFFVSVCLGLHYGWEDWNFVAKIAITLGTVTCVFWWVWVMKKLHDMATWWIELRESIDQAAAILNEAKQDLKEIRKEL